MNRAPVFYDASGRRRRRFRLAVFAFALLLVLSVAIFVASILRIEPQPALPFEMERPALRSAPDLPLSGRQTHHKPLQEIYARVAHWMHLEPESKVQRPLAVAFHVPWDDASTASLARHINQLDWVIPGWYSVTGADHKLTTFPDPHAKAVISHAAERPKLLPMVQNALHGEWDSAGIAALLHSPEQRAVLLGKLDGALAAHHADGIFFDFENLPRDAHSDYRLFLREARQRFAARGWTIAIAVPVNDPEWDLRAYAGVADHLFVMAYDEHYQGGDPGPIASRRWLVDSIMRSVQGIDRSKLVIAVGNYAYDWQQGGNTEALSVEDAWLRARKAGTLPQYDRVSGNSHFAYTEGAVRHDVWLLDAAAAHDQMALLRRMGFRAMALWRLGAEDPSIWRLFGRDHPEGGPAMAIDQIPAGTDVNIEGTGEILRIADTPSPGQRRVEITKSGLIGNVTFQTLPAPYAIERTGYRPGLVALTFDDGPDPQWTPPILDILKAEKVPATFFIIGENALTQRDLLQRLIAEGHEVGNHTYTHPNLGQATRRETEIEINASQRLFQAFTGRSLRLFRAPYFGDAEPTTADEIVPAATAERLGYMTVGLHVDPSDWKRPGVQHIVDETIRQVEASSPERSGQVVLLHDSGGDRSQTIAALPRIIHELRARGYRFVPISELAGLTSQDVMPKISRSDRLAASADLALFTALGSVEIILRWLFLLAISLGITRALVLSALAIFQARREQRTLFPAIDPERFVTVLIPAFNEERVIEEAVRRVLASRDVRVEVIVIDDGSKDQTSEVVRRAFATDLRVTLLTLENGGKARALNAGLALAKGEIVIALDADTQFEPATIARLARWFVDPAIGAVAGNAKVGNRINMVTRWQALEYITAQNLERRAFARLNAMMVVPGAVGAWRLTALQQQNGYPANTLAEDQDLTIAIQRAGWKVHYDQFAVAWTEAPESFAALARQRFRWAYGTLQCLWKHRTLLLSRKPAGLALIGLPQAVFFQILFAAISPLIDLALIASIFSTTLDVAAHGWARSQNDIERMLLYWLIFCVIDLLAGVIAFALERRERWHLLLLLIPQRFGYRQIMYYVVLKALVQATRGLSVGWGKQERSARVTTEGLKPD